MAKSKGHEPAIVAELRSAIEDSGANCYALAKRAGVDETAVRRFVSRQRSLTLDSAAKLAEALGLKLVRPAKPRKFSGKAPERIRPTQTAHPDQLEPEGSFFPWLPETMDEARERRAQGETLGSGGHSPAEGPPT